MAAAPDNFPTPPEARGCRIERQTGVVEATLSSDPSHLASVRTAIESLSAEAGFDSKATGEIGLVVNEAIANIIRHAYGCATEMPIVLRAEVKAGTIEITLRDWGSGRSPAELFKRKPPDPLTPGGLGLLCMQNLMDEVLFTPQPRGMLLTMRRTNASRGS